MQQLLSGFAIAFLLFSCSKPLPALEGVDLVKWKEDKQACQGKRLGMVIALRKEQSKLKGLSEMNIIKLLGKPDENELYKRNQKFFRYYIAAGPGCPDHEPNPDKLIVRFNAMGYAQLVSISRD